MSLKVTGNRLTMVQPSISLKHLWLKVYVHSVVNFSNKRLNIYLLQMDFNFVCVYVCSMIYSLVSLMGMFVSKDSISQETSSSSSSNGGKFESISQNC